MIFTALNRATAGRIARVAPNRSERLDAIDAKMPGARPGGRAEC